MPDQHPEAIFERLRAYVEDIAPPSVLVDVKYLGGGPEHHPDRPPGNLVPPPGALEATFGREPLYVREGGSIPVAASFERILGLPVVLLGFTPPDDHAHAPNEYMSLRNYETAIRTVVRSGTSSRVAREDDRNVEAGNPGPELSGVPSHHRPHTPASRGTWSPRPTPAGCCCFRRGSARSGARRLLRNCSDGPGGLDRSNLSVGSRSCAEGSRGPWNRARSGDRTTP